MFILIIYDIEKREFLKYSALQGKAVNVLGFLKESLKGGNTSLMYLRTLFEKTL